MVNFLRLIKKNKKLNFETTINIDLMDFKFIHI